MPQVTSDWPACYVGKKVRLVLAFSLPGEPVELEGTVDGIEVNEFRKVLRMSGVPSYTVPIHVNIDHIVIYEEITP